MYHTLGLYDCLVVRSTIGKPPIDLRVWVEKIDVAAKTVTLFVTDYDHHWDVEYSKDEPDVALGGLYWDYSDGDTFDVKAVEQKWRPNHALLICMQDIKDEQDMVRLLFVNKPKSYMIVRSDRKAKE